MRYMAPDHWPTKSQAQKVRYHAKKIGCKQIDLSVLWHKITFQHVFIYFIFKPLQYEVRFCDKSQGITRSDMADIQSDLEKAFDFCDWLEDFAIKNGLK